MTPNPFSGLVHSRKFWLLILDTIIAVTLYFAGKYAAPTMFEDARFLIAILQPVFITVILSITLEDRALIAASGGASGGLLAPSPVKS